MCSSTAITRPTSPSTTTGRPVEPQLSAGAAQARSPGRKTGEPRVAAADAAGALEPADHIAACRCGCVTARSPVPSRCRVARCRCVWRPDAWLFSATTGMLQLETTAAAPSPPLLRRRARPGAGATTLGPSERVTWENCPNCWRVAAVGWVNGRPVEFDCPGGCRLTTDQVKAFVARRGRPPAEWLTRS